MENKGKEQNAQVTGEKKQRGGYRPGSGRKPKEGLIRKVITYALTKEQWDALFEAAGGENKLHGWLNKSRVAEADRLIKKKNKEGL